MGHFHRMRSVSSVERPTHATSPGGPSVLRSATAAGPAVPGAVLVAVTSAEGDAFAQLAAPALSGTGSTEWPAWQPTHLVPVPNRPELNPGTCAGPLADRSTRPRLSTSCSKSGTSEGKSSWWTSP